jgi:hypothetical protein
MEPLLQDTRGIVDFHALEFHVALDNNEGSSQMIDYLRGANITISNPKEKSLLGRVGVSGVCADFGDGRARHSKRQLL